MIEVWYAQFLIVAFHPANTTSNFIGMLDLLATMSSINVVTVGGQFDWSNDALVNLGFSVNEQFRGFIVAKPGTKGQDRLASHNAETGLLCDLIGIGLLCQETLHQHWITSHGCIAKGWPTGSVHFIDVVEAVLI